MKSQALGVLQYEDRTTVTVDMDSTMTDVKGILKEYETYGYTHTHTPTIKFSSLLLINDNENNKDVIYPESLESLGDVMISSDINNDAVSFMCKQISVCNSDFTYEKHAAVLLNVLYFSGKFINEYSPIPLLFSKGCMNMDGSKVDCNMMSINNGKPHHYLEHHGYKILCMPKRKKKNKKKRKKKKKNNKYKKKRI
eukprot:GHVR01160798.1.p1 GENE.GHVR01160798.1~~GHVR01160798.1.p1  ORF type:complete len:196 (+),score=52.89 GHVR01160798.1:1-588(+)